MYSESLYKPTAETHKLETELLAILKKLPPEKQNQTVTKAQFDVFLKNIPDFAKEHCKKNGIPLGSERKFIIRCLHYERK